MYLLRSACNYNPTHRNICLLGYIILYMLSTLRTTSHPSSSSTLFPASSFLLLLSSPPLYLSSLSLSLSISSSSLSVSSSTDTKPPHNDVLKQPDRYYRHSHTSNHLAPPKRVHSDRVPMPAPGASLRHLRFRDIQDMESSVMKSMSSFNPRMSVTESVLGKSVVPQQKYMKMGNKKRGHRILCLDGGGIKVCYYCCC